MYTDSSSARQLASRQGSGKIRHLAGKLPWIQEKTADGSFQLRQVPTAFSIADLGTKTLSRQRLFHLVHECGLVYLTDLSRVGADEFAVQNEKHVNSQQLKKISKAILRMSIAMGVAGGPGPMATMAQQCDADAVDNPQSSWVVFNQWMVFTIAIFWNLLAYVFCKACLENLENA